MEEKNEFPRRSKLYMNTPAELAIRNAISEVEKVGADPRLTRIINELDAARERLSDYIDGVAEPETDKLKFYKDESGDWRWILTAKNNKIREASSEGFENLEDCQGNARNTGTNLSEIFARGIFEVEH